MNDRDYNSERRRFFRIGALSLASLFVLPKIRFLGEDPLAHAQAGKSTAQKLEPVKESDALAKSLNYVENAKAVKTGKRAADPQTKDQFCDNCMFYGSLDKEKGTCQIFQGKTVRAKGWCASWAKKPA
ncbi:MAG: high-potential iron-sulfur protein [Bdellovibrionota bacterium]